MNNFLRRAAILIALAALAELSGYLHAQLELTRFDDELKELTS